MSLSIIVAVSNNNCIGGNNGLLWKIPADLKFFKETTTGHTIVMGKKTYQSIGRPLPNRRNIVITRDTSFSQEGVEVAHSIEEALDLSKAINDEVFIIGGGEIYRQFLPYVDKLYVNHIHGDFEGDTFFPTLDQTTWKQTKANDMPAGESTEYPITFATYERI